MKQVARLLNDMVQAGVILDYAVFGAVAQIRYTEAVMTMDVDVLVALPGANKLDLLSPIYAFCAARGFMPEGEAVRVGDWPVQFIPAFNRLTTEALREAETGELDGLPLRVVRADYLAVIALSVGRANDHVRINALLESGAVTPPALAKLAERYNLLPRWETFKRKFIDA